MAVQKASTLFLTTTASAHAPEPVPVPPSNPDSNFLVPGAKLRRMLGISAVTLWRWRHDGKARFPTATVINDRLYFDWHEMQAWLEKRRATPECRGISKHKRK